MRKIVFTTGIIVMAVLRSNSVNAQVGGLIFTVEGGSAGGSIDGVPATTAGNMICPYGITSDASDNLYLSDRDGYDVVRKIEKSTGLIYTVAGKNAGGGGGGFSGDGGPATNARLNSPMGI